MDQQLIQLALIAGSYASGVAIIVQMVRECIRCHKLGRNYEIPAFIATSFSCVLIGYSFLIWAMYQISTQ